MHIGVKITTSKEIAAHLRNGSCSENAFSLLVYNKLSESLFSPCGLAAGV